MPIGRRTFVAVILVALVLAGCGGGSPTSPGAQPTPMPSPTPSPSRGFLLVGAADIGWPGSPGTALTGQLVEMLLPPETPGLPSTGYAATFGDNAYFSGSYEDYIKNYDPFWGPFKSRTRPSLGNHEYESRNAEPSFRYFGSLLGPDNLGYYDYIAGTWHAVVLNSNIARDARSAQAAWFRSILTANPTRCTVVYWHHPRWSSGRNGDDPSVGEFWNIAYEHGVDVVLNGHDHLYERFAPQTPLGTRDDVRGIRQFTVGTGGAELYEFRATKPNSEVRLAAFGVIVLELLDGGYRSRFIADASGRAADEVNSTCH